MPIVGERQTMPPIAVPSPQHRPRVLAVAAAMLVLSALGGMRPVRAETLAQVVAFASETSPTVRAALSQARATGFEVEGAGTGMNPRFGVFAEPGTGRIRGVGRTGGGDVGLAATQPIYDGDRTRNEVGRQKARLAASNHRVELAQADVALKVSDAYLETLKQQRIAELTEEYVRQIESLRERVVEIVRLDRGRGYDLLQIDSRLNSAQLALAARRGSVQEQWARLDQLTGRHVTSLERPSSPPPPEASVDGALEALDNHPSVMAARADVEAARRLAARADAWSRPNISVRGRINSPEYPLGEKKWFGGYDVGLVSDWNPFDGGAGAANARAAHAQIASAEDQVDATRRELAAEVARDWTQVQARASRAGTLAGLVSGARKVRSAYWEQFQIGKRTMVDLLNAENETYQSAVAVETEQFELLQARYRLLGAQALLLPWFDLPGAPDVPPPAERGFGAIYRGSAPTAGTGNRGGSVGQSLPR